MRIPLARRLEETAAGAWEPAYRRKAAAFSICRFLDACVASEIEPFAEIHGRIACRQADGTLA